MKIGIDISQMAFPGTGVATYTQNLVENLLKIDRENEYVFFFSSMRKSANWRTNFEFLNKSKFSNFKIKNYRLPPLLLEYLWNKFHLFPVETFTGSLDVFHTSDWLEPPASCPKVTTIHDLAIFKYPETFMPRGGHNIVANLKRKLAWVAKESRFIVAVSENTKRDIVEILKIPENRIRVIYEACDTDFTEGTKENTERIKKKYKIEGKYLLSVGTREPRKNLMRVIEAFEKLQRKDLQLVIAGKFGWGEEMSNVKCQMSNVKLLGYVTKEELAPLYAGAQCLVYPSLYEGFGLPVLDAMASGCPVVTSNISSLPEVAGKAAILVNPVSVEEITEGIEKAIKNQKELIGKGFEQAKKFSWEKTALDTLKIYREAAKR